MKIQMWSVGKDHEPAIRTAVEDFTKRISRYYPVDWKIIPVPKQTASLSAVDLKKKEARVILEGLQAGDCLVALDEGGRQWSSGGLAQFIQARGNGSVRNLIFLIGGAYGLDETVLKRADHRWCLSQLTFPHQLVRLILAEQLYRACTIQRNEKYHH